MHIYYQSSCLSKLEMKRICINVSKWNIEKRMKKRKNKELVINCWSLNFLIHLWYLFFSIFISKLSKKGGYITIGKMLLRMPQNLNILSLFLIPWHKLFISDFEKLHKECHCLKRSSKYLIVFEKFAIFRFSDFEKKWNKNFFFP